MSYVIYSIEGNRQRLDGGAMFGNVPRPLWSKWTAPDEENRIPLACRAFLIHDTSSGRRILLETGIGTFFEPKLQARFGVTEPGHQLLVNLATLNVVPEMIDVVVLSHLHFDHAGGLLTPWRPDGRYELVFPKARFLVSTRPWRGRANTICERGRPSSSRSRTCWSGQGAWSWSTTTAATRWGRTFHSSVRTDTLRAC